MNRKEVWNILDSRILPLVQRPARYTGGEVNSVSKDPEKVKARIALVFPDVYEIGMSNLGIKILYEEINSKEDFYAERVFSPWIDMEKYMRNNKIPMFSLETHSPLCEFDIIGFSLQTELCYTNVINILDLAGIPIRSEERIDGSYPLVIAGGLMAYTPEPMAPFIDMFVVGDGENIVVRILEFYKKYGRELSREKFLEKIVKEIEGLYAPALRNTVKRHIINDFKNNRAPDKLLVPLISVVHDRASIEIMRGCPRLCRFCQAGMLYKPVRKRDLADILDTAYRCIKNTGYGEIGLLSLSSADFGDIGGLTDLLLKKWRDKQVSVSLPSMRVDTFNLELIDRISKVKKTGITLAPEAASQRLLDAINKGYKPEDIINVAEKAFRLGYRLIKLYFMIGLPGEDISDLDAMADILLKISKIGFSQVNVTVSTMIPKPHTPFQWMPMIGLDEILEKQRYLRSRVKTHRIKLKFHDSHISILEAAFGRGDRKLGEVIYNAWRKGARFDQWDECFNYGLWEEAFRESGARMADYLAGLEYDSSLPWGHIDTDFGKEFLKKEAEKAEKTLKNRVD